MLYSSLFSVLFFSVSIVSLVSGIFVLQDNNKADLNRCYFVLTVAVSIWSVGFAFATSAASIEVCELWRRVSAIGWGSIYGIILHFILIITGKKALLKKWWLYIFLYLPAAVTILAFAVPSGINQTPYQLFYTEFGWANTAVNNIWDWIFYIYYAGYMALGLSLLFLRGKKTTDKNIKKQSYIVFISFVTALVLGSITDIVLSSIYTKMPQMAPIVMLIPIIAIYHTIKKYGFIVAEPMEKSSALRITFCVILYVILSYILINRIPLMNIEVFVLRGIVTQLQMLLSIYLALKENKPGCIAACLINVFSIIGTVIYFISNASAEALPGLISYLGVLVIIALVCSYKNKVIRSIEKIKNQQKSLEESEKKLYHMAYYDALTGLPNKELFVIQLDQALHAAKRSTTLIGIIFIDLDSFKSVNDTMGHATGDIVLKEIGARLASCLRKEDTVSRYGGDEFLIKVANIKKVEHIKIIIDKITNVINKAVTVNNTDFFISASIGVAVYPADGEDSDTLIRNADIAMYSAKNRGKNQHVYCSPSLKDDIIKNMKLRNDLYRALDNDELYVHYQPQIKTETQEIIGFEALLRWNHKEYGVIAPDIFIPMAEQTGLIKTIGLWVIKSACEQCKKVKKYCNKEITISVNLSIEQLKDVNIAEKIYNILDQTETDPKNVQIEITESIAANREPSILQRLKEISDIGVSISIDDFGTGYSSLSRLKTFPINLIKIDMEFVRGISSKSKKDKAIIKSIIQIARNLELNVLAEGVETEEQYLFLKKNKCDLIQGFYFYKPLPAKQIEQLLKDM